MKINKRNPAHWIYLALFGLNAALARGARRCLRPRPRPLVILYGHKLNGNLLSLYEAWRDAEDAGFDCVFLTMDPVYWWQRLRAGPRVALAIAPSAVVLLARARCIVSDHGLHAMQLLLGARGLRFADVWHGIPFKGWDESDFRVQHRYDEIWVSSALMRQHYLDKFGFTADQVHVTGYGRVDALVRAESPDERLREAVLGATNAGKIVLFAPTWQHGTDSHTIYPFGVSRDQFLQVLTSVCRRYGASCVFRTHLNSGTVDNDLQAPLHTASVEQFPDTERMLLLADVLICDWSSIAFDYLVLNRPTIFLDVPAPFPKGHTLGPEFRFGAVVPDLAGLEETLDQYLRDPATYLQEHGERCETIRRLVYDDRADGNAAVRYINRLHTIVARAPGEDA